MAWIDERTEFADASTDVQQEAGTSNIGDIIDLGSSGDVEIGEGKPLYLHITVDTAGDGGAGAAGTTAFQLVSDGTSTIATDGTQTIHFVSDTFLGTDLDQGDHLVFGLPTAFTVQPYERFLALQAVQAVEGEDALVISAWISPFPGGAWRAHADAVNSV